MKRSIAIVVRVTDAAALPVFKVVHA